MNNCRYDSILGCLLGTAVGDSIGLPTEGMSRKQIAKRNWTQDLKHRLVFGRGMISDDTEHTAMVLRALIAHPESVEEFEIHLAEMFRWWLAAIPAGVGLATARAIIKLWLGCPPSKSGVRSAGNGPAMRSAIIGAYFCDDASARKAFTLASARLTHSDERASEAARLVAEAAALACKKSPTEEVLLQLEPLIKSQEMTQHFEYLCEGLENHLSLDDYTEKIGYPNFVTGFAPCTVAVAIYSWLRYRGDFSKVITKVITCGGDTDTIAAIAGGIAGAECGEEGIPNSWLTGVADWPVSINYMRALAECVIEPNTANHPQHYSYLRPVRNLIFLVIILIHGFLRLGRKMKK